MGRPSINPDKKNNVPLKVYLDKKTNQKLNDFSTKHGMSYISNAARFILVSFFENEPQPVNINEADRQKQGSTL